MVTYNMNFAWQSFVEPDPESELQGVVGYLQPSRYRTVPRVLWHTREIEAQLAESGGLVGYALRAKLPQKKFWAVAAWESDESLQRFVESDPHAEIRATLERAMKESWFQRFDVRGEEVPLDIDEALERV
jgi:heme-degrading monooxygenase HmoA